MTVAICARLGTIVVPAWTAAIVVSALGRG